MTARVRERLAALRAQCEMTESGLARAAHLRQQDVNRFFHGDMKYPALDFMDAIARVFHHSLADVLAEDMPKPSLTESQREIVANLKAMEPVERAAFEKLIRRRKTAGSGRRRG